MKTNSIFLLSFIFILASCQKLDHVEENFPSGAFGFKDYKTAQKVIGDYVIFGLVVDGIAVIDHQITMHPYNNDFFQAASLAAAFLEDRNPGNPINGGDFYVNDHSITWDDEHGFYDSKTLYDPKVPGSRTNNTLPLYGNDITYKLVRDGITIVNTEFYAPKYLEYVDFPHSVKDENGFLHTDKEGLTLSWNADPLNTTGVLVEMAHYGHNVNEGLTPGGPTNVVRRFFLVKNDQGQVTLPNSFTHDFQSGDILRFTLWRGSFKVVEGSDGGFYKFYSLSIGHISVTVK